MTKQKDINLRKRNFENAARREIGQPKEMAQPLSASSAVSGGSNLLAKIQVDGIDGNELTCKALDSSDLETGDNFTVYCPETFNDANIENSTAWPPYEVGSTVVISKINDKWYLNSPIDAIIDTTV